MFYECEGQCHSDKQINGNVLLTWTLHTGEIFTCEVPAAMVEGHSMQAEWSLRWHDDDPDSGNITVREKVWDIRKVTTADGPRVMVYFEGLADPLPLPLSEESARVGFAPFFDHECWFEMVEM